jgi:hypothetical protein
MTIGAAWNDFLQALDFAGQCFERWHAGRLIRAEQLRELGGYYQAWRKQLDEDRLAGQPPPGGLGWEPPGNVPADERGYERGLRHWRFVGQEVRRHAEAGRLSLAQAHACLAEVKERLAALRRRIEQETVYDALPAGEPSPPARPAAPRRSLLEIVLDPRGIQWLLAAGAALLVVGLVIFLYAAGVFENPVVVAALLGTGTAGLLAGGWAVLGTTPYRTVGRALTLLACLIMPLNLWFYHAQGLHPLTLYEHLWAAALVCCVLYALSAWVLRDPLFVYVLVGGVTLASLLLLASVDGPAEFWQITHPALLLTVLGLVTLHAERAFPEGEGPFTRRRFGLSFFWSGHALLAVGLLLVLGAQLYGHVYRLAGPQVADWGLYPPAPITTEPSLKTLALILVLASTYAYFYSDLVVRRAGAYLYPAVFTLLWAEVLAIDLLDLPLTDELAIAVLALTGLAAHLLPLLVARDQDGPAARLGRPLERAGYPLGLLLCALPVLFGVWLHARWLLFRQAGDTHQLGWAYVGAMLAAAVSCRAGAHLYRHTRPGLAAVYFFGTAAATLVGAAGLLAVLGLTTWAAQAPLLMLVPVLYLVASRLYHGRTPERPLVWVAQAATAVMLASSLAAAVQGFHLAPGHDFPADPTGDPLQALLQNAFGGFFLVRGQALNLALAAFFVEATAFYALAAAFRKQAVNVYLATAMACAAVWQLLSYACLDDVYYTLAFALAGLALLVGYRFAVLEKVQVKGLAGTAFRCANALLSLAFAAGALLTLSHLAIDPVAAQPALAGMLAALLAVNLVAVALVRHAGWRRWYVVAAVTELVLIVLVLSVSLTFAQKLEVASFLLGLALLVLGHIGWYREQERQSDLVTFTLMLGSVLLALPLAVATLAYRYQGVFHWPDEVGLLAAGIVLLATGLIFRLSSTTLTGGAALVLYVLTLLVYLPWSRWVANRASLVLMAGGAVLFGAGLLLSVYRDRLLALPERIRRREGVFRVFGWR